MSLLDLPLFGEAAPAAVRRPVFEVSFGSAPREAWLEAVTRVVVERTLAPGVDWARVDFLAGPGSEDASSGLGDALGGVADAVGGAAAALGLAGGAVVRPEPLLGEEGSVALGYEDGSTEPVFAGAVDALRRGIDGPARLGAGNGGGALARLRLDRSYEKRTAGEIVSDLAAEAGVATGTVEDGIDLDFLALDAASGAWRHIAELARRSGFAARFTAAGELDFVPFEPGDPVAVFTYGVDVAQLAVTDSTPVSGGIERVGEGAAGSAGGDAWAWLVKDPEAVRAQSVFPAEGSVRSRPDPALRSADAVATAAEGAAVAAGLTHVTGHLWVPGTAALVPGGAFEVKDAPQPALNGIFVVRRLRHELSKAGGFVTRVEFSKEAEVSGGGLLDLLGGLL